MSHHRLVAEKIAEIGPQIMTTMLARAAFNDFEAMKALLPYVAPKVGRAVIPVSSRVEIDVSSTEAARLSIQRIAAAIGEQQVGLEEGTRLMDVVGRALERMATLDAQDLLDRIEKLETEHLQGNRGPAGRNPVSRLNGSTPQWGNIEKHPSIE